MNRISFKDKRGLSTDLSVSDIELILLTNNFEIER